MIINFGEVITPSGIASLEYFKCPIKDEYYFKSPCKENNFEIKKYKKDIGKAFEQIFFCEVKDELSDLPVEKLTWQNLNKEFESINKIKEKVFDIFEANKAYLIYDEESKGIPLDKRNLLVDIVIETDKLNLLKNLIEKRSENCPNKSKYVYLDALLVERKGDFITFKVLELKSSKEVKDYHIFQALWYINGLDNCFKNIENVKISQNFYIINNPVYENYNIQEIKIESVPKSINSIIERIIDRIVEFKGAPPLSNVCSNCNLQNKCIKKSISIKSPYLYKSLKDSGQILVKKGFADIDKIKENLFFLQEDIMINSFLLEKDLMDQYDFFDPECTCLPQAKGSLNFNYIPMAKLGIICIPDPINIYPLILSLSITLDKNNFSKIHTKFEEMNIIGMEIDNNIFYSTIIFPTESLNIKEYQEFIFDFLLFIFVNIGAENKLSFLSYYNIESKIALASFLREGLFELVNNSLSTEYNYHELTPIYQLLSFSDNLEMESFKSTGGILEKVLIYNKCLTNEPYTYRLAGLRGLNNNAGKEDLDTIKSNIILFSNDKDIQLREFTVNDESIIEMQKEFYDYIKPILNFDKQEDRYFNYSDGIFTVKMDEKLMKYFSFLNWEIARLFIDKREESNA